MRDFMMSAMLELLEMMEHFAAVERLDVSRLRRRETPNRPAEMHEVRLDRMRQRMHTDLFRKAIAFARVARAARGHDVRPLVRTATRQRHEMVACERLARLEVGDVPAAILTAVVIPREEKRVGDLPTKTPRNVDELRQPNDCWARHRKPLRSDDAILVRLDNLGFAVDHEAKGPAHRDHR